MPVVSVVLAGLMMRSRGAIRLGMRIACRRTPTAIGFGGYSLWTPDSRECRYSVRIQCVRLHDRAIRSRGSPGSDKLESVCTGCEIPHTSTNTGLWQMLTAGSLNCCGSSLEPKVADRNIFMKGWGYGVTPLILRGHKNWNVTMAD